MSTATEAITLNVPPLDRSRHAAPQVFEHLRELIIGVRLVPGTVLQRAELAAQYGVHEEIDSYQKELDTVLAVEPIATEGYHAVCWVGRPDLLAARLKGLTDGVAYPVDAE